MNHIQQIQELTRTLDATLAKINPTGLATGENAMCAIKFISQIPNFEQYIGSEFMEHIQTEIEKSKGKTNVREHVKKIWMYPKYAYDPWIQTRVEPEVLNEIHHKLSLIKFQFAIFEGKIYLISSGSISNLIFDCTKEILPENIVPNSEVNHVTVVNSNIVYDCGIDKVTELVGAYPREFSMEFGNIKSTVSNDWPVFSECYVIEVKSELLNNFVNDFNQKFGKTIKPSLHITFAVRPRSLFQ